MFLAASLSTTPDFENAVDVAPEFTGTQVVIPHPTNGVVYLKLRDDPAIVQTLTMPVTPAPAGFSEALAPPKAKPAGAADSPADDQPASGSSSTSPTLNSAPAATSAAPQ
jgi:hypothetical protein